MQAISGMNVNETALGI